MFNEYISPFNDYISPFVNNGEPLPTDVSVLDTIPKSLISNARAANATSYHYLCNIHSANSVSELISKYEKTNVKAAELDLFVETNENGRSNIFGTFCLAKFSPEIKALYTKAYQNPPINVLAYYKNDYINTWTNYPSITQYFHAILNRKLNVPTTYNNIEIALRLPLQSPPRDSVFSTVFGLDEIFASWISSAADTVTGLKFTKEDYTPSNDALTIEDLLQGAINVVDILVPDFVGNTIGVAVNNTLKTLLQQLNPTQKRFAENLLNLLKEGFSTALKILQETGNLLRAFVMGIVNGFLDTVALLLKLIATGLSYFGPTVSNPFTTENYLKGAKFLEQAEDLWDVVSQYGGELFSSIKNLSSSFDLDSFNNFLEKIKQKAENYASQFTAYDIAYFLGNVVFEIIVGVALAIFTGGLGTAAQGATKMSQLFRLIFKEALSTVTLGVIDLAQFLKVFIIRFIDKAKQGFKAFIEWIEELLGRGVDELIGWELSRETAKILENSRLLVRRRTQQLIGSTGGMIVSKFSVEYKGVVVFEGSANEVEALAKQLKGMTSTEKIAHLERLLNKVFIIGRRFLDHIEKGHITIRLNNPAVDKHIVINGERISNPAYFVREYTYFPGEGFPPSTFPGLQAARKSEGGFHLLSAIRDRTIRIVKNLDTKRIPTGETVRITKIEYWVEELNKWVPKDNPHTFFPSGWNIEKVKEVVKEATENIIENDGYRYIGTSKEGIRIEFIIDLRTRELQTAYIVF